MVLLGQLKVGLFHLDLVGRSAHPQDFVKVSFPAVGFRRGQMPLLLLLLQLLLDFKMVMVTGVRAADTVVEVVMCGRR
jgi:hypothetical protein